MLAKTETRAQLDGLGGDWRVVALCGDGRLGVVNAGRDRGPRRTSSAALWGAEDLIAAMAAARTSRFPERDGTGTSPCTPGRRCLLAASRLRQGRPSTRSTWTSLTLPGLGGRVGRDAARVGLRAQGLRPPEVR